MLDNVVVLGGLGEVGSLLSRSLGESGIPVLRVDRRAGPDGGGTSRFLQADAAQPGAALRSAIAGAGCVIVCLPEDVALAALGPIVDAMGAGALWVDTLSVKTVVCRALAALRPPVHGAAGLEILSINPMFAPALGWRGNGVAAVEVAAGERSAAMLDLLGAWGAHVERLSAAEHDALTAAVQVATHAAVLAFGAALLELDYDLAPALRLATPPHRLLLALLNRIVHANPAVYAEIQRHHPHAPAVWQAMSRAVEAIAAGAGDPSLDTLPRWFNDLRFLLSSGQGYLRELGDRLVAQVSGEAAGDGP